MSTTLTFLGGAGTVTGSKFLLTVDDRRVLVDCGLFQGEKALRLRNWADFPVDPGTITDVLLTHAHMDHCGYLPALVRDGFHGHVLCTTHSLPLVEIVLRDAGHLQERDALDASEGGWSKHQPPLPLYRSEDVERTLPLLRGVDYDSDVDLGGGMVARWVRAGHILGSASVRVQTPTTSVLFSGDLGRVDHPVLRPREVPPGAEVVVVESTYGDREHPEPANLPHEGLADVIRRTVRRGGSVLVPAFAVDRTEVVLQTLAGMRRDGRIPSVPTYVNSPMSTDALDVYRSAGDEVRADVDVAEALGGDVRAVRTADDSRALTEGGHGPSIILSSSGMATGGRVLYLLERMLPDPRNAVVLTGYQAVGTRGRALADGVSRLKMHGRYVGVRAEILQDHEFSVHADSSDLVGWVRGLVPQPRTVYCVHGEERAATTLADRLGDELGLVVEVPEDGRVVSLDGPAAGAPEAEAAVAVAANAVVAHGIPPRPRVETDLRVREATTDRIVLEGTVTVHLR
jgi:metallo-beta-lactamase family protein